jgi:hypothetical protein
MSTPAPPTPSRSANPLRADDQLSLRRARQRFRQRPAHQRPVRAHRVQRPRRQRLCRRGIDLSYRLPRDDITLSAGYAYLKNDRGATRRDFRYTPLDILPFQVAQQRPDFLLSDFNVYNYDIVLTDISAPPARRATRRISRSTAAMCRRSRVAAAAAPADRRPLRKGRQTVTPIDIFGTGGATSRRR